MFAVIKTGGKQYRVSGKDVIEIERLDGKVGDKVTFDNVLMTGDAKTSKVGSPALTVKVEGKIVAQGKGPKLYIQKFRRRKNSRTRTGHRQQITKVEITSIK